MKYFTLYLITFLLAPFLAAQTVNLAVVGPVVVSGGNLGRAAQMMIYNVIVSEAVNCGLNVSVDKEQLESLLSDSSSPVVFSSSQIDYNSLERVANAGYDTLLYVEVIMESDELILSGRIINLLNMTITASTLLPEPVTPRLSNIREAANRMSKNLFRQAGIIPDAVTDIPDNITLFNSLETQINFLYVSSGDGFWSDNLLDDGLIAPGRQLEIETNGNRWLNIRVIDASGRPYYLSADTTANWLYQITQTNYSDKPVFQSGETLRIVNNTDSFISRLVVTDNSLENSRDLLIDEVIAPRSSYNLQKSSPDYELINIIAGDQNGNSYRINSINTGMVDSVSISADNMVNQSSLTALNVFKIYNNTGNALFYLYVAPINSRSWGRDLLGDNILLNDNSFDIMPNRYGNGLVRISAEDQHGTSYSLIVDTGNINEIFISSQNQN